MILAIVRTRLKEEHLDEYQAMGAQMHALAIKAPGYLSHKSYKADDGERVTIVAYASHEALRAWAVDAEHVKAKKLGRTKFYSQYHVQICEVTRDSGLRLGDPHGG